MRATTTCNIELDSTVFADAQNKPNMTDILVGTTLLGPDEGQSADRLISTTGAILAVRQNTIDLQWKIDPNYNARP
jgi:hypothetical protein